MVQVSTSNGDLCDHSEGNAETSLYSDSLLSASLCVCVRMYQACGRGCGCGWGQIDSVQSGQKLVIHKIVYADVWLDNELNSKSRSDRSLTFPLTIHLLLSFLCSNYLGIPELPQFDNLILDNLTFSTGLIDKVQVHLFTTCTAHISSICQQLSRAR